MNSKLPALSYTDAKDTYETLHLWTQIAGKIKVAKLPWINHSWHVTLIVTPTGLTTAHIPAGERHFEISFDFCQHKLLIVTRDGDRRQFQLEPMPVAIFYQRVMENLKELGIDVSIHMLPNELENAIPFDKDFEHASYNPQHAEALHKALLFSQDVMTRFRAGFIGKCSPVHFFWGSFDLAVSRFSGRKAPLHPGGIPNLPDRVAQEAYSHEVCSAGFWPGNEMVPFAAYYVYIYPEPAGYNEVVIRPAEAYYDQQLREFLLPYEAVRLSSDPEEMLMDFFESSYEAAANLAKWERKELEK